MAEIIQVSKVEEGTRLMRWFLRHFPSMPQSEFYKLCRGGQIRVNSSRVSGNKALCAGDKIRIPPTIEEYKNPCFEKNESGDRFSLSDLEQLRKCIIYNDKDIVIFNKPAGLAVQGGTGIRKSIDKMATALFPYDKISLVHRLDRETSGILVVAKNQYSAQFLSAEFQNKTAHKEYIALLNGDVNPMTGTIDNYMLKGQVFETLGKKDVPLGQRPQRAITTYRVLSRVSGCMSLVLFSPKTGRTHQLRVHSAISLNSPIVGDTIYGPSKINKSVLDSVIVKDRLYLVAYKITFTHPTTGKSMTAVIDLPDFMKSILSLLEIKLPAQGK